MFNELEVPHIISFELKEKKEEQSNLLIQYLIQEWLLDFSIGFYKNIVKCLTVKDTIEKAKEYVLSKRKDSKNHEITLEVIYKNGKVGANNQLFDDKLNKIEKGDPNDISALRANSNFKNIDTKVGIRPIFEGFEQLISHIGKIPDSSSNRGGVSQCKQINIYGPRDIGKTTSIF